MLQLNIDAGGPLSLVTEYLVFMWQELLNFAGYENRIFDDLT
jgi:hypothetical protein